MLETPSAEFAINCTDAHDIVVADIAASSPSQAFSEPVRRLLSTSLSASTHRAYAADLAHFRASGRGIPCEPRSLAEYLADLAETHAVASVRRRVAAIAKAHRTLGFDDPCRSEIIKAIMQGIRRTKSMTRREAQALLREDLFTVLARMDDRTIDVRDKALLLVGFAGAFRRSELVGLDCGDVEHVGRGIVLHLRRSKTDQTGQGRKIAIPHGRTRWCPVRHLSDWLTHAKIEQGPLFRTVNRHGHIGAGRLSGGAVTTIIKRRVEAAGFNSAPFSGHSLRSGFATSAASLGASSWKIRQQTGHKSDSMLARYIRDGDMFTANAAGAVL